MAAAAAAGRLVAIASASAAHCPCACCRKFPPADEQVPAADLNGCACGERAEHRINYEGDVNLTFNAGFDGVKIDSCGAQKNMTLYAELFNATGKPIVIENCHQGQSFPDGGDPGEMGEGWCPYNFFRTSGDIINVWDRVIENLMSVEKFLKPTPPPAAAAGVGPAALAGLFPPPPPGHATPGKQLSRPGCWACKSDITFPSTLH
eukprot:SAG22_NODE_63_length_23302_cov_17.506551_6_plen_205_part_00